MCLPLSSVGFQHESSSAMLGCCASELIPASGKWICILGCCSIRTYTYPPPRSVFSRWKVSVFWDVCTYEDTRVHHHRLVFRFEGLSVFSDVVQRKIQEFICILGCCNIRRYTSPLLGRFFGFWVVLYVCGFVGVVMFV